MERVNTGGATEIVYSRGWKPREDKEFDERWEKRGRIIRRRMRRERTEKNINISLGIFILGLVSLIFKNYYISGMVMIIGVGWFAKYFLWKKVLIKRGNWITEDDIKYDG